MSSTSSILGYRRAEKRAVIEVRLLGTLVLNMTIINEYSCGFPFLHISEHPWQIALLQTVLAESIKSLVLTSLDSLP